MQPSPDKKSTTSVLAVATALTLVVVVCLAAITAVGTAANQTFTKVGAAIGVDPAAAGNHGDGNQVAVRAAMPVGILNAQAAPAMAPAAPGANPNPPPAPESVSRKIIYSANIAIIVENFPETEAKFRRLVSEQKGSYIAKADVRTAPGRPRQGTWTVRVPVAALDSFLDTVGALGELSSNTRDSQDVTDQFYDTDARLRNQRVEEERLIKHLDRPAAKLEEILAVEKELTRVRGEIEQLQGRLNYLSQLSALTTVTVTINERKGYEPPTPVAPSFGTVLARRFEGSLQGLLGFGQGLVVLAVVLIPWAAVLGVLAVPVVLIRRRMASAVPPPAEATSPSPAAPAAGERGEPASPPENQP